MLTVAQPAFACGWWGDGEDDDGDAIAIGADGKPLPEPGFNLDRTGVPLLVPKLQVPSPGSGYGLTVRKDGRAVPYLATVSGGVFSSIAQLQKAHFSAVIDLGTSAQAARLHRRETEGLGMKYFNIPITKDHPDAQAVARFAEILSNGKDLPILVYSTSSDLLGKMWALYRLHEGANRTDAISDARGVGLSQQGARDIPLR